MFHESEHAMIMVITIAVSIELEGVWHDTLFPHFHDRYELVKICGIFLQNSQMSWHTIQIEVYIYLCWKICEAVSLNQDKKQRLEFIGKVSAYLAA